MPDVMRDALEEIRDLYTNDNIRPAAFAVRAGAIAVTALAWVEMSELLSRRTGCRCWNPARPGDSDCPVHGTGSRVSGVGAGG